MCQLEYIQVLYAFHFDSLPKNEHETRTRFLSRSLEFPKRRNDTGRRKRVIGPALRNASRCGGSELLRVVHPRCSAKNTSSASAGSQSSRETSARKRTASTGPKLSLNA